MSAARVAPARALGAPLAASARAGRRASARATATCRLQGRRDADLPAAAASPTARVYSGGSLVVMDYSPTTTSRSAPMRAHEATARARYVPRRKQSTLPHLRPRYRVAITGSIDVQRARRQRPPSGARQGHADRERSKKRWNGPADQARQGAEARQGPLSSWRRRHAPPGAAGAAADRPDDRTTVTTAPTSSCSPRGRCAGRIARVSP